MLHETTGDPDKVSVARFVFCATFLGVALAPRARPILPGRATRRLLVRTPVALRNPRLRDGLEGNPRVRRPDLRCRCRSALALGPHPVPVGTGVTRQAELWLLVLGLRHCSALLG